MQWALGELQPYPILSGAPGSQLWGAQVRRCGGTGTTAAPRARVWDTPGRGQGSREVAESRPRVKTLYHWYAAGGLEGPIRRKGGRQNSPPPLPLPGIPPAMA